MAEALRINFCDNWSLTSEKIDDILNLIYVIDSKRCRCCTPVETLFYKNINPTAAQNIKKQVTINTIKSRIKCLDIKKELNLPNSDLSLDNYNY